MTVVILYVLFLRLLLGLCFDREHLSNSKTVFHHISKHLEFRQKYSAARRIFNSLLRVWKLDETLSRVFDILLPEQVK